MPPSLSPLPLAVTPSRLPLCPAHAARRALREAPLDRCEPDKGVGQLYGAKFRSRARFVGNFLFDPCLPQEKRIRPMSVSRFWPRSVTLDQTSRWSSGRATM